MKMSISLKKNDFEPALCRCCGALTKFRVLNVKYSNNGRQDVYSDMIKTCFGIEMSKLDSEPAERLICAPCMHKLCEAWSFKIQVQETEQRFLQKHTLLSKSKVSVKSSSETKQLQGCVDGDNGTLPDGLDDELDPEQLEEYYSLGSGTELRNTDQYSSSDDIPAERVDTRKRCTTEAKKVNKKSLTNIAGDKKDVHNALCLVKYSYVCPFKNRFNHVLCYYCAQYFLDPALLREHTLSHPYRDFKHTKNTRYIKVDITRIDCKLCPQKIDTLEEWQRHMVAAHGVRYYPRSGDGVVPYRLVRNVNSCALCSAHYPQFHALVRHMDQHYSNYVCETCGMGFIDEKSLEKHMPAHDGKRYPCETCGSSLKSEYTLLCHKKRMHEKNEAHSELSDWEPPPKKVEVEVPCQGCDQKFKSRKYLAIHVRKVHMNYRHLCQVCGQKFFTRFALNNHMPTHTGERNFKCKECGKTYPRLKTLKEHMRIHTNDRRYRCHICGQAFIQNCSLKGHMKSKHPA